MAKGVDVAVIKTADLVRLWGDEVVIRKSTREGARFPLYLATSHGPVPVNSYAGQDALLEFGVFKGATNPENPVADVPENPEPVAAAIPEKPESETPETPGFGSAFSRFLSEKIL